MVELSFFSFVELSFVISVKCLGVVGVAVFRKYVVLHLVLDAVETLSSGKEKLQRTRDILAMQIKNFNTWVILLWTIFALSK